MWEEIDNKLCKSFIFNDFSEALGFICRVGLLAEQQNHHPEIWNIYNRVNISLQTHDAGNIVTEKDHHLASSIDQLL
ncbi:MAG: 4a-hydroxytetrahydrobiopterin dehydratase [Chitinophagales bacterium]|nr:4a-hydroxytetrahydrobiopterin dehydratase [Chitinophagales bacterium]